uniref:RILP-like protein 1 isoform X1 n=1 Tax=Myxine glutinosa TaxID=7769 RepID=UPI00358F6989
MEGLEQHLIHHSPTKFHVTDREGSQDVEEPCVFHKDVSDLTVVDVYGVAVTLRTDLARMVDAHGHAVVEPVVPRLVWVLEALESLLESGGEARKENDRLHDDLERLLQERAKDRRLERLRQQDAEQCEDSLREEAQELINKVAALEEQTHHLQVELRHQQEPQRAVPVEQSDEEGALLSQLRSMVHKQRERLTSSCDEVSICRQEIQMLEKQLAGLTKSKWEYQQKQVALERQVCGLIEENASLQSSLRAAIELGEARQQLICTNQANDDGQQVDPEDSEEYRGDPKDRNRAQFTLEELQQVLQDRHELKTKIFFIKEELKYYKWELQKHGAGKCVVPPRVAQLRSKRRSLKAKMLGYTEETLSSSSEDEVDGQKTHNSSVYQHLSTSSPIKRFSTGESAPQHVFQDFGDGVNFEEIFENATHQLLHSLACPWQTWHKHESHGMG